MIIVYDIVVIGCHCPLFPVSVLRGSSHIHCSLHCVHLIEMCGEIRVLIRLLTLLSYKGFFSIMIKIKIVMKEGLTCQFLVRVSVKQEDFL